MKYLTVKEMKEALKDASDDATFQVYTSRCNCGPDEYCYCSFYMDVTGITNNGGTITIETDD